MNIPQDKKTVRQLRLPLFKTDKVKFSVSFVGSNFWNMLTTDLRIERSRTSFRNKLTNYSWVKTTKL